MQINTVDIKQNYKLIDAISWINKNTEPNARIVGDKFWHGWMEIKLKRPRIYIFSENLTDLLNTIIKQDIKSSSDNYLILYYRQGEQSNTNNHLFSFLYSNGIFKVF